jgi:hypothetical protein
MALEPGPHGGVLVRGEVVDHDMQFAARIGGRDPAQEGQELLVPVSVGQASVTRPVATSSAANSVVVPCRT